MAPEVLDLDALAWLQGHLWIISALYGCARPFDAVEPYRLEMAAPLSVGGARDLYDYWGPVIARAVAGADVALVVNLASVEYARAVLPHLGADAQVVTCIFGEDLKGGRPVQRATASKVARGSMVRWMAEHQVEDAVGLESFDVCYHLEPELCLERRVRPADPGTPGARERVLVFMRDA